MFSQGFSKLGVLATCSENHYT